LAALGWTFCDCEFADDVKDWVVLNMDGTEEGSDEEHKMDELAGAVLLDAGVGDMQAVALCTGAGVTQAVAGVTRETRAVPSPKRRKALSRAVRKQLWRQRVASGLLPEPALEASSISSHHSSRRAIRAPKPWKHYRC